MQMRNDTLINSRIFGPAAIAAYGGPVPTCR